jgi:NAD(P)-dependent dehydrogenase (short-subunit alcohol dehydrogenase family)
MTPVPDHGERSYRGTGKLIGRKALITGGDSGIGRAAAIAYAREGGGRRYQLSARRGAGRSAGGRADPRSGRKAVPISGDIRDEGFCQKLVARAARELGGLDILVNNAGRQHSVDNITDLSSDQFDWTLKTNLYYGSGQVFGSSGGTGED